jgi:hypothetical protein
MAMKMMAHPVYVRHSKLRCGDKHKQQNADEHGESAPDLRLSAEAASGEALACRLFGVRFFGVHGTLRFLPGVH